MGARTSMSLGYLLHWNMSRRVLILCHLGPLTCRRTRRSVIVRGNTVYHLPAQEFMALMPRMNTQPVYSKALANENPLRRLNKTLSFATKQARLILPVVAKDLEGPRDSVGQRNDL